MRVVLLVSVIVGIALVVFGSALIMTPSQSISISGRIAYPNGETTNQPDSAGWILLGIGVACPFVAFILTRGQRFL